jgi:hypothetical protein
MDSKPPQRQSWRSQKEEHQPNSWRSQLEQLEQPPQYTKPKQPTSVKEHTTNATAKIVGYIIGFIIVSGIIGGIRTWWNNNQEQTAYDTSFIQSCENNGGSASFCQCGLKDVRQKYTTQQAEQELTSSSSPAVQQIAVDCATYK